MARPSIICRRRSATCAHHPQDIINVLVYFTVCFQIEGDWLPTADYRTRRSQWTICSHGQVLATDYVTVCSRLTTARTVSTLTC
jgi:hypothetical protein